MSKFFRVANFASAYWAVRRRLAWGRHRRHIIFRHEGAIPKAILDEGLRVTTLTQPEQLANYQGIGNLCDLAFAEQELKAGASVKIVVARKSTLAVAFHRNINDWYVPLGAQDQVIYAVSTARSAMGRGLGSALTSLAVREIGAKGGSAYLDCAVWNTRAHRAFQKIGFRRIGPESHLALTDRVESPFISPALRYIREPEFALSVIVVNFNGRQFIGRCLQSLLAQTDDLDFEIVVVDNASTDGSAEYIASQFPTVHLARSGHNGGFAYANNLGLARARGRNILLLNPDTVVPAGLLRKIVDRLDRDSSIGVAGVAQKIVPGKFAGSALRNHSPIRFLLAGFLPKPLLGRMGGRFAYRYEDRGVSATFFCDAVVGCFMAMRRTIVEEVGGLDDRIFMYGEEREFCWRVRQAGHKILYMGDLHITHERGATTRSIGVWRKAQMQAGQLLSIRYTQGVQAARRAALAMLITHLVRLPLEFVWFGPKYTQRLQSRTIRIRNAVASIIRMPERSTQRVMPMSLQPTWLGYLSSRRRRARATRLSYSSTSAAEQPTKK